MSDPDPDMHNEAQIERTAEMLREMVRHEDDLRNHRITWLCQLQGFLFASLGFAWGKSQRLTTILAVLGLTFGFLILIALLSGTAAHLRIRKWWRETKPADHKGPDVFGLFVLHRSPPIIIYFSAEN